VMRLIPEPPGKIVGGEVLFEGRDILKMDSDEVRKVRGNKIAMVFQDPMTSLNPVLTIGRQIDEALELHMNMDRHQARQRTIELLEMVGIPEAGNRADDYPHQFSGGMRQRVMIAMGLSCNPRILIADEPTTALDVTIQAQILALLTELQEKQGVSILLITHDLAVVAETCHRVGVAYAGDIVEMGEVNDVLQRMKHPYTQGLLAALPRPTQRGRSLQSIEGSVPDGVHLPPGCPFHPRCPQVMDICRMEEPPLFSVGAEEHVAACYLYGQENAA